MDDPYDVVCVFCSGIDVFRTCKKCAIKMCDDCALLFGESKDGRKDTPYCLPCARTLLGEHAVMCSQCPNATDGATTCNDCLRPMCSHHTEVCVQCAKTLCSSCFGYNSAKDCKKCFAIAFPRGMTFLQLAREVSDVMRAIKAREDNPPKETNGT